MSARMLHATGAAALALAAFAGVLAFAFLRAQAGPPAIDLSGEWNIEFTGGISTECTVQVTQTGEDVSGSAQCSPFGAGSFTGTVETGVGGIAFEFDAVIGAITIEADGTVSPDGGSAEGTWSAEIEDITSHGEFTAGRKQAGATPTGPPPAVTPTPTQPAGPTNTPAPPTATSVAAATATATAPAPPGVVGDANCNEDADAIDAALILQLSAALLDELACQGNADVNGDGRVDAIDAALVLQFVAGLLDSLPS